MEHHQDEQAFLALARELAAQGHVPPEQQQYFDCHRTRLTATLAQFDLWQASGWSILEIGPFYGYTPVLFKRRGNEVTVIEGTDPVILPMVELYKREGIACHQIELSRLFGLSANNAGKLPFPDNTFDAVACFETMEHFHFNPVPFVRDLHRILKPGGRAYITVPNQAKLDNRIRLALGRSVRTPVSDYFKFATYNGGEFLGFHWREYVLSEIADLFAGCGFTIERAAHMNSFQQDERYGMARKVKRAIGSVAVTLVPSLAANCTVMARK